MSFSRAESQTFLDPLIGKSATFLLDGRQTNLNFARMISTMVGEGGEALAILDLDAFYSSHADRIFSSATSAEPSTIVVPKPGSDVEREFARFFALRHKVLVIDSLNSFFHLLSVDGWHARTRKVTFALEALSQYARTNDKIAILSMYRRERSGSMGTRRPISQLSDLTVSVTLRGDQAVFRVEKGSGWAGREFSTRIP